MLFITLLIIVSNFVGVSTIEDEIKTKYFVCLLVVVVLFVILNII